MEGSGARGGAAEWGTVLKAKRSQVQFPMVSLEFFIDVILLAALWPGVDSAFMNISWGVKAACELGWQPHHNHVPTVLKSGSLNLLEPSGPVQACNGIAFVETHSHGHVPAAIKGNHENPHKGQ